MKKTIWTAVLLTVIALVGFTPSSAQASQTNRFVDTQFEYGNFWYQYGLDDEYTLKANGSYWNSNYALMVQLVLWADGFMADSDVDCKFGPRTAADLHTWQIAHSIPGASGQFDGPTRSLIESQLMEYASGGYFYYQGEGDGNSRIIVFHELDPSSNPPRLWDMNNPFNTSEWHHVAYSTGYFSLCSRP